MRLATALFSVVISSVGAAACSGGDGNPNAAAEQTQTSSAPAAGASFSEEDLTAFERGLAKEIEAIRAAQQEGAKARDPEARGRAMQAQWEDATIPQGAAAAGMDEARYRRVRAAVHDVLRTLDMQGKIDGPLSMDLSRADDATKTRLSQDPIAALPAESADALRGRLDQLTPLWAEYVSLSAVAG